MRIGPIQVCSWQWWMFLWKLRNFAGIFRNHPDVVPGRWGFYILGLEIGSRNPGNKTGVLLKELGLWPW